MYIIELMAYNTQYTKQDLQKGLKKSGKLAKKAGKKFGEEYKKNKMLFIIGAGLLVCCCCFSSGAGMAGTTMMTNNKSVVGKVTQIQMCSGGTCIITVEYTINERTLEAKFRSAARYTEEQAIKLYYEASNPAAVSDNPPNQNMQYLGYVGASSISMGCVILMIAVIAAFMVQPKVPATSKEGMDDPMLEDGVDSDMMMMNSDMMMNNETDANMPYNIGPEYD